MKRIKHWIRKAWQFCGDDRVGLFVGGAVLVSATHRFGAGDWWMTMVGLALCLWSTVPAWRSIGRKVRA